MWNAPHRLVSLTTWSQPVALSGKAVEIRGGQALLEDTGHSEWPRGFTTQIHFLLSDSWQGVQCYLPVSPILAAMPSLNDGMVPLNSKSNNPSFPSVAPVKYLVIARKKATDIDGKTVSLPQDPLLKEKCLFKDLPYCSQSLQKQEGLRLCSGQRQSYKLKA